jgi:hypothetical protein
MSDRWPALTSVMCASSGEPTVRRLRPRVHAARDDGVAAPRHMNPTPLIPLAARNFRYCGVTSPVPATSTTSPPQRNNQVLHTTAGGSTYYDDVVVD